TKSYIGKLWRTGRQERPKQDRHRPRSSEIVRYSRNDPRRCRLSSPRAAYFPAAAVAAIVAAKPIGGQGVTTWRDELLRPSLGDAVAARAPYSVRTTFLTAFFGGPLAALAIIVLNSVRLRRWLPDLPVLGVVLAGFIAFVLALYWTEWGGGLRAYLQ